MLLNIFKLFFLVHKMPRWVFLYNSTTKMSKLQLPPQSSVYSRFFKGRFVNLIFGTIIYVSLTFVKEWSRRGRLLYKQSCIKYSPIKIKPRTKNTRFGSVPKSYEQLAERAKVNITNTQIHDR